MAKLYLGKANLKANAVSSFSPYEMHACDKLGVHCQLFFFNL